MEWFQSFGNDVYGNFFQDYGQSRMHFNYAAIIPHCLETNAEKLQYLSKG